MPHKCGLSGGGNSCGWLKTMATIETLFATRIYRAEATGVAMKRMLSDLEATAFAIAADDTAGRAWSSAHHYAGYTSYASLADLPMRAPVFADLAAYLDGHALKFANVLGYDPGTRLRLDSLWINILEPGGQHSGHIHPNAALSGTFYVTVPDGASALKFEDPRLTMMMAAPPLRKNAPRELSRFASVKPKAGTLLLWESWLRHEVPVNQAQSERVSISFNFAWN